MQHDDAIIFFNIKYFCLQLVKYYATSPPSCGAKYSSVSQIGFVGIQNIVKIRSLLHRWIHRAWQIKDMVTLDQLLFGK